eukprot:TRINITY_DN50116_c0_g2_i3.p1 TRINITY_DN50116_c0_g2~~TRINITY_DN50116_c0_g2_i3.p1  ORF type:complete len:147 (+),score=40.30 TRINITY_DN50116_c0_g2_i3:335-775(+)
MLEMGQRLLKKEGPQVLFAGISSSVILCANPAIQYMTYERLRLQLLTTGQRALTPGHAFVVGALSKALATVLTYPVQVLQAVTREENTQGLLTETLSIWNAEGPQGFFKGMGPKLLQTVSNAAIMFMCYEQFLGVAIVLLRVLGKK